MKTRAITVKAPIKSQGRYRYSLQTVKIHQVCETVEPQVVSSPGGCVDVMRAIFADLDADQEHMVALMLNVKNRITGFKVVASGGSDRCIVYPKMVFRSAILLGAEGIILGHNHPSGDPEPSQEDKHLTKCIVEAGKLLEIRVLDHVIIGAKGYFSFQENRLL